LNISTLCALRFALLPKEYPMPTIACNLNSYGPYRNSAFEHLSKIGLTNVEIFCPTPEDASDIRDNLEQYGLTATSMIIKCAIGETDAAEQFAQSLDVVSSFAVPIVFTSIKAGETDRTLVYDRLRQIGDYYYNRDITATGELEKVIDYVAAVHLKDTNGEFQTWNFPALGEGVVDFSAIFDRLYKRNYTGPFTFELEGIKGEDLSQEDTHNRIEQSLSYLREKELV
jgi:sugar phosphate isomerase/epimerase